MYKKLILFLMQTKIYAWALKHIIPFLRFSNQVTAMRGDDALKILELAKPGDFIVTTDKKKLTSLLIPGKVDHAALVGFQKQCYEMTHEDFKITHLLDVLYEADAAALCRIKDIDLAYAEKMVTKAILFRDAKYDVSFTLGVKALYCSELVYEADFERRLEADLSDLAGLGRPYISPVGLLEAKNAEIIYATKGLNS